VACKEGEVPLSDASSSRSLNLNCEFEVTRLLRVRTRWELRPLTLLGCWGENLRCGGGSVGRRSAPMIGQLGPSTRCVVRGFVFGKVTFFISGAWTLFKLQLASFSVSFSGQHILLPLPCYEKFYVSCENTRILDRGGFPTFRSLVDSGTLSLLDVSSLEIDNFWARLKPCVLKCLLIRWISANNCMSRQIKSSQFSTRSRSSHVAWYRPSTGHGTPHQISSCWNAGVF